MDPDTDNQSVTIDAGDDMLRQHRAIEEHVTKVANYDAASGDPITTGAELSENGEPLIVYEVAAQILLPVVDTEKKSDASPDSISAKTDPSGGAAANAENSDSTSPAGVLATASVPDLVMSYPSTD